MIAFENRVVVPPYVLIRRLDGEAVLLNLETERYFGLNSTGSHIWERVTGSPNIGAAYEQLQLEYDVVPEVFRDHFLHLLGELVDNGLLRVQPSDVGTPSAL